MDTMRKKILGAFVLGSLLVPSVVLAADQPAQDSSVAIQKLQNQVKQLQAVQDNNDKQMKNIMAELKKVEAQLPELNKQVQEQIQAAQDNAQKMVDQLKTGYEKQLKDLVAKLNTLKERLAKAPPNEAS
jgi:chromosome segregation ATPase